MNKDQLSYYRGHIIRKIASELNRDEEEVHTYLKGKFIRMKYLDDKDMTRYINDVSVWAAEMGVILEEPNARTY
jgi:hypothetical protein